MMAAPSASTLIDRVDDYDRPIGVVERGAVFEQHANFRVVHIFVFDTAGRLLLQKLGHKRERNPLRWGSSVAGYLYAGESYHAAARRRLREELGLEAELDPVGRTMMIDRGSRKFIMLFRTTVSANEPRIAEKDHIEDIRFWELTEIEEALARDPEIFTETFRHVFSFFKAVTESDTPEDQEDKRQQLLDLYKVAVEEYRFQVELNWKRTQYFLALNIAILGVGTGLVKLQGPDARILVLCIFMIGCVSAILSIFATRTQHMYYRTARDNMQRQEELLQLPSPVIRTTPGMSGRKRTVRQRLGRVTTINYVLLSLLAAADIVAFVYVLRLDP
jgi:isopentenyldiphosphate isomerase